jgi:hypothetical protein
MATRTFLITEPASSTSPAYRQATETGAGPLLYKAQSGVYRWSVAKRERPSAARRASYKIEVILEELKGLAARVGLEVREEKLLREIGYQVRSGCCRFREQNLLFLDRELPAASRMEVLLEELARRDLGAVYVSPELRRILGKDEGSGAEHP